VSTETKIFVRLAKPRGVIAIALGVLVVGVVVTMAIVRPGGPADDANTARSASQVTTAPSAVPENPAPSPVATLAPSPSVAPALASSWLSRPSPEATAPGVSAVAHPRPLALAATGVPAAAPAVSKASCNPPYEFDAAGNKRWKRECL
jgi:hypothetical protein